MPKVEAVKLKRHPEMSTRLLLEAAASLIAEQGYERTTLLMIGKRAGYSHGLVTQRFGSKDGLLHELVHRMTTNWLVEQINPQMDSDTGVNSVAIMLEEIQASAIRDPGLVRTLYALMFEAIRIPSLHADMVEIHRAQRQKVTDVILKAQGQGEVHADLDPVAFANLVVSALRGAAYQWLLDPNFPFHQTITDLVSLVRRDLAMDVPIPPTPVKD